MRNHNSHLGFYTETLASIYLDTVSAVHPQDEIARDTEEIRTRARNEGMHFLTKVLPALGKSIDVSLAKGTRLDVEFSGFKKKPGTNLPRFMHSAFSTVFRSDGVPWFATWYADLQDHMIGLLEVEEGKYPSWYSEPAQLARKRAQEILHLLPPNERTAILADLRDSNVTSNVRNMIQFNRFAPCEWREAIETGMWQVGPLPPAREAVNSRREAMVTALKQLRQVCYSFYKLELPYSREQEAKTIADFVSVDADLSFDKRDLSGFGSCVLKEGRRIIRRILANADPLSGIPKHGPGSVATGEKQPEKHIFSRFYTRLASVFPYDQWFFCNANHLSDSLEELQAMEELEAGTAKVVLVPKDSRGPRLISCEPLEYQWVQQALMRVLVDTIETHSLSKGRVNFARQEINQGLALRGSSDLSLATLDMKEASDRVSLELVKAMFPERWYEALYASRSSATRLPDGRVINLKKFAPMGSAVCFPVEALIFWALSVASVMCTRHLPLRIAATKVFVYGDDIVCDVQDQHVISSTLPEFGIMLNDGKCCTAGPFKESCGTDAFYGHFVTPTKLRSVWCESPEPSMLASYVEYSNEFHRRGMYVTAEFLEREVQWVLRSHRMAAIPTVSGGEPSCIAFVRPNERPIPKNRALGCRIRFKGSNDPSKPDYQKLVVQGYRLESKRVIAKTYGWPFLLRKLTELEAKDRDVSLETPSDAFTRMLTGQYPIAHRVRLKRAWTPLI